MVDQIEVELLRDGVALLRVVGELDLSTNEHLAERLRAAARQSRTLLVVDLAACRFVGRIAFDEIDRTGRRLRCRGAELVVRHPPASFTMIAAFSGRCEALVVERPGTCPPTGRRPR